LLRAFAVGGALTIAAGGLAAAQTEIIVRSVMASVSDADGRPILGLHPDDFLVEVNGAALVALEAAPARYPLVLIIDTSTAARELLTRLRAPLRRFAERSVLSPMSLVTFGDTPVFAVKFTEDARRISRGIEGLFARPDTAGYLLDGLHRVAQEVTRLEVPVVDAVVITVAPFDASRRDPDKVISELVKSRVRVHIVAERPHVLGTVPTPAPRSPRSVSAADMLLYASREQGALLNDLSAASGGSFQQVDLVSGLAGALQRIHERHLGEYVVGFEAPRVPMKDEALRLRVNLPGARVTLTPLSSSARR